MKKTENRLLFGQFAVATFLCGLVWFVHVVHYPLMANVGAGEFVEWHQRHVRKTGWIVIVPMLVELLLAGWWLVRAKEDRRPHVAIGSTLLLIAWAATFFGAVPAHDHLAGGFDVAAHESLMRWNLVRAVAWGGRSLLFGVLLIGILEREGTD